MGYFGFDDTPAAPAPEPTPPREARAPRKTKAESATPTPAPDADLANARAATASAKASQDAALEVQARELADLAARVARAGTVQSPDTGEAAPAATPVEYVVARWNRYGDTANAEKLGLPAGSILQARAWGATGVEVQVRVPAGTVLLPVADALVANCAAWGWGAWEKGADSAVTFILRRSIVGEDPASPWRAAGRTAAAVYANEPRHVRGLLWERAGLTVRLADGSTLSPTIRELRVGDRGPELLLRLPGGLPVEAAIRTAPTLASLFRCPDLMALAEGSDLRIRLNTKPAERLPQMVPLRPSTLYRPTSPEQAISVGKRITLPVGVTLHGDRLERIEIAPAKVPHGVLVGAPGSGKSRWVRGAMTAWTVSGGLLAIGDPKGGELVRDWLPGCVHVSTSKATIYRLLLWAQVEMKRRLALQGILQRRYGISDLPVQPVLVVIDEYGQLMTELSQSTDPADKAARSELERVVTNAMQVGRSVGIHLLLITQNALASSLPGGIAQAASFRVSVGRPTEGASGSGSIGRLFPAAMRDRAAELGATIPTDSPGMLLTDFRGEPVIARAFYGYTPGEEPDAEKFADLPTEIRESWTDMRAALAHVPPTVRFGWKPDKGAPEDWQSLSLSSGSKGDRPTVSCLKPVPLDRLDHATGRVVQIPENAQFDPLSDAYIGGFDPIDLDAHFAPHSY